MTKTQKIKKLLEDNRAVLLNGEIQNGICFDGIINEPTYENVVVLLKETNGNDDSGEDIATHSDWDYVYWLKHQQADNEPEMKKDKKDKEYLDTNPFYYHTFKKLCHWLCMLFDVLGDGKTDPDKYLMDGKVDIETTRKILNKVALINLKKSWGKESTNAQKLHDYAVHKDIAPIIKQQLDIVEARIVLCCSPDVFWIANDLYGNPKKIKDNGKELFIADGKAFVKFIHPQWYGKKEDVLAIQVKETFEWMYSVLKQEKFI